MAVSIKLQKYLAECGLGSRREIERVIQEKLVVVNGETAHLGQRVFGSEVIHCRGELVKLQQSAVTKVLLYHKPLNQVCTRTDPQGRETVFSALPACNQGRWIMVGRLDRNTTGLLLFTNHGELANRLMHPKYEVERTYSVVLNKAIARDQINTLLTGVRLSDGMARCKRARVLPDASNKDKLLEVVLTEGRNREVRRLFAALGFKVVQLKRLQYGNIRLCSSHRVGSVQSLSLPQIKSLEDEVNLL